VIDDRANSRADGDLALAGNSDIDVLLFKSIHQLNSIGLQGLESRPHGNCQINVVIVYSIIE
jgi:hypothetical protein